VVSGYPGRVEAFSVVLSTPSKLVLIVAMLFGRHREQGGGGNVFNNDRLKQFLSLQHRVARADASVFIFFIYLFIIS
jgi:hypothetical protein